MDGVRDAVWVGPQFPRHTGGAHALALVALINRKGLTVAARSLLRRATRFAPIETRHCDAQTGFTLDRSRIGLDWPHWPPNNELLWRRAERPGDTGNRLYARGWDFPAFNLAQVPTVNTRPAGNLRHTEPARLPHLPQLLS